MQDEYSWIFPDSPGHSAIRIVYRPMIIGFANVETERFFKDGVCRPRWRPVSNAMMRKLDMLDAAPSLEAVRSPPGNRLESLKADRAGQFSIRVNDRWRVCFTWTEGGPDGVETVDYH